MGYPLVAALRSRFSLEPHIRAPIEPFVSVLIPPTTKGACSRHAREPARARLPARPPRDHRRVGGSTDDTFERVREHAPRREADGSPHAPRQGEDHHTLVSRPAAKSSLRGCASAVRPRRDSGACRRFRRSHGWRRQRRAAARRRSGCCRGWSGTSFTGGMKSSSDRPRAGSTRRLARPAPFTPSAESLRADSTRHHSGRRARACRDRATRLSCVVRA